MHFMKKSSLIVGQILFLNKTGFNMIKEGVIGLAFRLFDEFFLIVRIFGIVVRFVI